MRQKTNGIIHKPLQFCLERVGFELTSRKLEAVFGHLVSSCYLGQERERDKRGKVCVASRWTKVRRLPSPNPIQGIRASEDRGHRYVSSIFGRSSRHRRLTRWLEDNISRI